MSKLIKAKVTDLNLKLDLDDDQIPAECGMRIFIVTWIVTGFFLMAAMGGLALSMLTSTRPTTIDTIAQLALTSAVQPLLLKDNYLGEALKVCTHKTQKHVHEYINWNLMSILCQS